MKHHRICNLSGPKTKTQRQKKVEGKGEGDYHAVV